jgi:hypothetical protein
METSLPTPMTARVYVNLPEGIYIRDPSSTVCSVPRHAIQPWWLVVLASKRSIASAWWSWSFWPGHRDWAERLKPWISMGEIWGTDKIGWIIQKMAGMMKDLRIWDILHLELLNMSPQGNSTHSEKKKHVTRIFGVWAGCCLAGEVRWSQCTVMLETLAAISLPSGDGLYHPWKWWFWEWFMASGDHIMQHTLESDTAIMKPS